MWKKSRPLIAMLMLVAFASCEGCRPDGGGDGGDLEGVSTEPIAGTGTGTGPGGGGQGAGGTTGNPACLSSATRMVSVYTGEASVAITEPSFEPSTTARGNLIAFTSLANLAPNQDDQNQVSDIYLHDTTDCTTRRISVTARGDAAVGGEGSSEPAISGNGNVIAFTSTGNFESDQSDVNGFSDIYIHDIAADVIQRVSIYTGDASTVNDGDSFEPSISADGNVIAFTSRANLEPDLGDSNGVSDVYTHTIATRETGRVSIYTGGASTLNDGDSFEPSISGDGTVIAFTSRSNLEPDQSDVNGFSDIYVHNRATNETRRVSIYTGDASTVNDGDSFEPSISADGNVIAFTSRANLEPDLGDSNGVSDVYTHTIATRETGRVSIYTGGASTLNDGDSFEPSISGDGTVIAFTSRSNLEPDQSDVNGFSDIYVHNRATNETRRASIYTGDASTVNDGDSSGSSIAPESGIAVTFASPANLQPNQSDVNGVSDVYIHR